MSEKIQVFSTQWPGLHKRSCFVTQLHDHRKRRQFIITMARLILLLLLMAPLILTSYADSGQKVMYFKILRFYQDTLEWPFFSIKCSGVLCCCWIFYPEACSGSTILLNERVCKPRAPKLAFLGLLIYTANKRLRMSFTIKVKFWVPRVLI